MIYPPSVSIRLQHTCSSSPPLHTSTGLTLTRPMYNLTAEILLVIGTWWWCMGRIKCKWRGSWTRLAAPLPLPCRPAKVLCKWSQSKACEWLYSHHHKPIKPHLRHTGWGRLCSASINIKQHSSNVFFTFHILMFKSCYLFIKNSGWSSLWCMLIAAVSSAVSPQLDTISHHDHRQGGGQGRLN